MKSEFRISDFSFALEPFAPLRETGIIRFLIFIAPRRQGRKE
jgi:hypothetical protein